MNISNIIALLALIVTFVFSSISLYQSYRKKKDVANADKIAREANELSKYANEISNEALVYSKSDYTPLIKLIGEAKLTTKSRYVFGSEVTFDFSQTLFDNNGDTDFICLEVEIENCGRGFISEIAIKNFSYLDGNEINLNALQSDGASILFESMDVECSQRFILDAKEKTKVNFVFSELENYDDINQYDVQEFYQTIEFDCTLLSLNNIESRLHMHISVDEEKIVHTFI